VKAAIIRLGPVIFGLALSLFFSSIGCSGDTQATRSAQTDQISKIMKTARIFPESAYTNSRLEVKFKTTPGTDIPALSYRWKRNGELIIDATGSTLGPDHFRKGDEISVEIDGVASDGTQGSCEPPHVVVRNTPPKVMRASTFLEASGEPKLAIDAESLDDDEDEVSYSFLWYRNGKKIPNQIGATLDPLLCQRGDEIHAAVIANDGQSSAPPFESEALTLPNHAPRITSTPTSAISEGRKYAYQLVAEDPDGDTVLYSLVAGPPAMSIDADGRIDWAIPAGNDALGEHDVSVKASDAFGGETIQDFTIRIMKREKAD
jgi:hypothetical protein